MNEISSALHFPVLRFPEVVLLDCCGMPGMVLPCTRDRWRNLRLGLARRPYGFLPPLVLFQRLFVKDLGACLAAQILRLGYETSEPENRLLLPTNRLVFHVTLPVTYSIAINELEC
jgi:hypothetical protein